MPASIDNETSARERGRRAEEVAEWYFRLNGFFLIPGFVVHPDALRQVPRTEADLLGIRLKGSFEGVWRSRGADHRHVSRPTAMADDPLLVECGMVGTVPRHLVAMVEVKASRCRINGPWSDRGEGDIEQSNMTRALSRVGFGNKSDICAAADLMYSDLRYEGKDFVVQYFAVGSERDPVLAGRYPKLKQLTFDDIAIFLGGRFRGFPEKLPQDASIGLWSGFGNSFRCWFESRFSPTTPQQCKSAVRCYIDTGRCN